MRGTFDGHGLPPKIRPCPFHRQTIPNIQHRNAWAQPTSLPPLLKPPTKEGEDRCVVRHCVIRRHVVRLKAAGLKVKMEGRQSVTTKTCIWHCQRTGINHHLHLIVGRMPISSFMCYKTPGCLRFFRFYGFLRFAWNDNPLRRGTTPRALLCSRPDVPGVGECAVSSKRIQRINRITTINDQMNGEVRTTV